MRKVCKNCAKYIPLESFDKVSIMKWHDTCKKCNSTNNKQMSNKLTKEEIIDWNGGYDDALTEYVLALLNGDFSLEDARKEILEYNGREYIEVKE